MSEARVVQGNCLAVMRDLAGSFDAVIADPPFGTGRVIGGGAQAGDFKARHETWDWDKWSTSWLAAIGDKPVAMFCPGSRLPEVLEALPGAVVFYWRKTNVRPGGAELEPVVMRGALIPARSWNVYNGDCEYHPCQKPLGLMRCIVAAMTKPGDRVLDPFAGSFTTGVACVELGRSFVGIELNPDYCRIGEARLRAAEAQGRLAL